MSKKKIAVLAMSIVWGLLLLAGLCASANVFGITSHLIERIYPQAVITPEEFTPPKAYLKDFTQNKDGSITSDSADPWIFVNLNTNGLTGLHTLDLNVTSATNISEGATIYYTDSYHSIDFNLQEGLNRISLRKAAENDNGLRLDLTSKQKQTLYIESIIINNNQYLTTYYGRKIFSLTLCFVLISLLCLAKFSHKWKVSDILDVLKEAIHKKSCITAVASMIIGFGIAFLLSWNISGDKGLFSFDLGNLMLWLTICLVSLLAIRNELSTLLFAVAYLIIHGYLQYSLNDEGFWYYVSHMYFNSMLALNLLLFLLIIITIQKLAGHLGNVLCVAIFGLYIVANLIKMKFQNALFSSADFALAGEITGIAGQYVKLWMVVLLVLALLAILFLCIHFRKKVIPYLKPEFHWSSILAALALLILVLLVFSNFFQSLGVNTKAQYLTNKEQLNAMGFGMYTLLEFSGQQNTGEPEGYDESIVADLAQYKDHSTENDTKPTVILILAESLFQVEQVPGVTFNTPLTANLAPYKVCNVISPSYGGRTAAAEFESLTGLSNLFIPGDSIPYTTYLKKTGHTTGSIAREFHDNGYMTYAVHANTASYYSRDTAYENMGFDDFISKEDFFLTQDDFLADNLVRDEAFANMILKLLENTEEPVFLFGASLEGHSPYDGKYDTTEVIASSEQYSSDAMKELSKYGQAVYNFDQQMGRIIDYFETSKKPVLIYVYGDHLPPVLVNSEDGYLNDDYLKYSTPLYAYSNYCDTSIEEEYISLSQVAPEILRKSGIDYRAYYDYIYQLRKKYPITHKNMISNTDTKELKTYEKLQWDLLQGQRYLLNQ